MNTSILGKGIITDKPPKWYLVDERTAWRKQMHEGTYVLPDIYHSYKENRDSELWRCSRVFEQLCEYIMFLEGRNG